MSRLGRALKVILIAIPLGYGLMFGATRVHVSGGMAENMTRNMTRDFPIYALLKHVPFVPEPQVVHVDQVGVVDAAMNALFAFCTIALLGLAIIPVCIAAVVAGIYGLIAGRWELFAVGILGGIGVPLFAVIFIPLSALALWVGLLIQPATPAYVVLWLLMGLPLIVAAAYGGGAAPISYVMTGQDILISRW